MESEKNTLQGPVSSEKLWTRPFISFLIINIILSTATQMVTPLLPSYLISMGATLTLAAAVTSIISAVALIARPFTGAANDFMNRKMLMFVSSLLIGLCVLGYAFAKSVGLIVSFRILHGLAFSFQSTTMLAFASTFIPRKRIGEGIGYMGMAYIISFSIGPSLGIFLYDNYGNAVCFATSAIISIVAALAILRVPYTFTKKEKPEGYKFKIKINNLIAKELLFLAAFIGIFSIGNGLINTYIKIIGDERSILNIGLYFTANAITMFAIRPLAGRILDKKGLTFILIPSYLVASVAMFFIGAASALWMIIFAGVLKAIGQGSGGPAIQAASIKILGKERSGVAASTCFIGQDIGNIIGPLLGGVIATNFGFANLFYDYAVFLIITCVGFFIYSRLTKEKVLAPVEPPFEVPESVVEG